MLSKIKGKNHAILKLEPHEMGELMMVRWIEKDCKGECRSGCERAVRACTFFFDWIDPHVEVYGGQRVSEKWSPLTTVLLLGFSCYDCIFVFFFLLLLFFFW